MKKDFMKRTDSKGFTLLELLLVVAGIAILATIVFVVLSPADTLNKFRDSSRLANIQAIMSAVSVYAIDNNGDIPNKSSFATDATTTICSGGGACDTPLSDLTDNGKYMISVPVDPSAADAFYIASIDANGILTISAPLASTSTIETKGKFNPL